MPVTLISIGPTIPILSGVVYAIPGVPVNFVAGAALEYGPSLTGPFATLQAGTQIKLGAIRPLANTTIKLTKVNTFKKRPAPSGVYTNRVINDGAIAYWRLNEAGGLQAKDSIGNAHGTISGGVLVNQIGPIDSCMKFTGGRVDAGPQPAMNFGAGSYTIEAWVYLNDSGGNWRVIIGKGQQSSPQGWRAFVSPTGGPVLFWGTDAGGNYTGSTLTIPLYGWHHVIWGYNAATGSTIYAVDGVFQTAPEVNHPVTSTDPLVIGCDMLGGYISNALIDEVAIYNKALTPAQILAHYNASSSTPYQQEVLKDKPSNYWRLNETSGLVAADSVGGAHGTISGGITLNQAGMLSDDKCMLFDGVNGKIVTTSITLKPPFTVEFWVKPLGDGSFWAAEQSSFYYALYYFGGSIGLETWDGNAYLDPVGAFAANILSQWHHIVLVIEPLRDYIYLDGVLSYTAPFAKEAFTVIGPLLVACVPPGDGFLNGNFDEVATYPYGLTPERIAAHYRARR